MQKRLMSAGVRDGRVRGGAGVLIRTIPEVLDRSDEASSSPIGAL